MAERIVVGDEEPAVAAALDHCLRGADRERVGVEHPLDRVGRAEFAVEVGGAGRVGDEQLLLFVGDVLHREPDRRDRHVHDQVDLLGVVPAPRDGAADVRLELMIADDHADRLAEHLAAEIVDRHLRRGHRALAGRCRRRPVHVGEDADLDRVVRDLGKRRLRRQASRRRTPQARILFWLRSQVSSPLRFGALAVFIDRECSPAGPSVHAIILCPPSTQTVWWSRRFLCPCSFFTLAASLPLQRIFQGMSEPKPHWTVVLSPFESQVRYEVSATDANLGSCISRNTGRGINHSFIVRAESL